jgi:hypothetical protein
MPRTSSAPKTGRRTQSMPAPQGFEAPEKTIALRDDPKDPPEQANSGNPSGTSEGPRPPEPTAHR